MSKVDVVSGRFHLVVGPWVLLVLAACLLLGCGSLKAYNTEEVPDLFDEDYTEDDPDNPTISLDECATLCLEAIDSVSAVLGCESSCGVDAAADYVGTVAIVTPLFGAAGTLQVDGGGQCELIQDCGDSQGECEISYALCLEGAFTDDEREYCGEEYEECRIDLNCSVILDPCLTAAEQILTACLDGGGSPERCQETYTRGAVSCFCIYDSCVYGEDSSSCVDSQQASASVQPLGADRWRVPRGWLEVQLDRIKALDHEVMLVPVRGTDGRLGGAVLTKVSPGDTLYGLGLRSGDILVSVGGLSPFEKDTRRFRRLSDRDKIVVEIRRHGKPRWLTYELVGRRQSRE